MACDVGRYCYGKPAVDATMTFGPASLNFDDATCGQLDANLGASCSTAAPSAAHFGTAPPTLTLGTAPPTLSDTGNSLASQVVTNDVTGMPPAPPEPELDSPIDHAMQAFCGFFSSRRAGIRSLPISLMPPDSVEPVRETPMKRPSEGNRRHSGDVPALRRPSGGSEAPGQRRASAMAAFGAASPSAASGAARGAASPASVASTVSPATGARKSILGFREPDVSFYSPSNNHDEGLSPAASRYQTAQSTLSFPDDAPGDAPDDQDGDDVRRNYGPYEDLQSLVNEFKFNPAFGAKINGLRAKGYNGWRRVRGDGNCFWRTVAYALIEQAVIGTAPKSDYWYNDLVEKVRSVAEEAERLEGIAAIKDSQQQGGFQRLLRKFAELREARRHPLIATYVHQAFCEDNGADLAFIRALKILTANYLVEHRSDCDVCNGIDPDLCADASGFPNVDVFNEQVTMPMGIEAMDLVQMAMPRALNMGLRIAIINRESPEAGLCDYGIGLINGQLPESAVRERPLIHIQLRMGHYDLLYFAH